MFRGFAVSLCVASLIVISAGSAIAAPQAVTTRASDVLVVQIMKGQVRLDGNGTVLVPVRARCQPPLDAFEVVVGVQQDTAFGSVGLLGTEFPPCDGRWHRSTVSVQPEAGAFVPGTATVGVFLGAYDPVADSDLDAEDTATVRL